MSQLVKLGFSGSEVEMPPEGRQLQEAITEISSTRRTASGRLKKQIIGQKRTWALSYSSMDHSLFSTLIDLYDQHISTAENLSLVYVDGDGVQQTVAVSPEAPSYTKAAPRRTWLYRGFVMRLVEV